MALPHIVQKLWSLLVVLRFRCLCPPRTWVTARWCPTDTASPTTCATQTSYSASHPSSRARGRGPSGWRRPSGAASGTSGGCCFGTNEVEEEEDARGQVKWAEEGTDSMPCSMLDNDAQKENTTTISQANTKLLCRLYVRTYCIMFPVKQDSH